MMGAIALSGIYKHTSFNIEKKKTTTRIFVNTQKYTQITRLFYPSLS